MGRPLGASRALWEIGAGPTDLRSLRARLDLDSGYLSRLVASLERDGLVAVEPDPADRRVRTVRPHTGGARRARPARPRAATSWPPRCSRRWARSSARGSSARWRPSSACSPPAWSGSPRPTRTPRTPAAAWRATSPRSASASSTATTPRPGSASARPTMRLPRGVLLLARLDGEAVGCGVLWHPRRRGGRRQAHVGGAGGARAGSGPAAARRARAPRPRARAYGRCAWTPTGR